MGIFCVYYCHCI